MQREGERKVGKYGVESKSGRKRKEEFGIVAAATMEMDSVVVGYRVDIPACESAGTASAVSRRARIPIDQFSVRRDLSKPCHFLPPDNSAVSLPNPSSESLRRQNAGQLTSKEEKAGSARPPPPPLRG